MAIQYNEPGVTASTMGTQFNEFYYRKKAVIDEKDEMIFSSLSKSELMPKNYGKTIKAYHYIPLLDDRNINDQGLNASGASYAGGNIYGSSKDVGTITSKLPALSETGGRVNRVGFTREELSADINELGFFFEWTKDSIQFDTDVDLKMHLNREAIRGAIALNEAAIQLDLLGAAGVVMFAGEATDDDEMTGEAGDVPSLVSYKNLSDLAIILDENKTPKDTKIIAGTRLVDTKTVPSCRWMFIGSALQSTLEQMVDYHDNPAFIPVEKYAAGTILHPKEVGKVGQFRIVVVQEMFQWDGAGVAVTDNDGYLDDGANYNVYPMLVVGDDSFVNIGFQSSGSNEKMKVITKEPEENVNSYNNPYAKVGFKSISWWYGTLILRPERIAIIKTLAKI